MTVQLTGKQYCGVEALCRMTLTTACGFFGYVPDTRISFADVSSKDARCRVHFAKFIFFISAHVASRYCDGI